jgi:hypothetical protein
MLNELKWVFGMEWKQANSSEATISGRHGLTCICVQIREDVKRGVFVEGLSEEPVHGVEDVVRLMVQVTFQTLGSRPSEFLFVQISERALPEFRYAGGQRCRMSYHAADDSILLNWTVRQKRFCVHILRRVVPSSCLRSLGGQLPVRGIPRETVPANYSWCFYL